MNSSDLRVGALYQLQPNSNDPTPFQLADSDSTGGEFGKNGQPTKLRYVELVHSATAPNSLRFEVMDGPNTGKKVDISTRYADRLVVLKTYDLYVTCLIGQQVKDVGKDSSTDQTNDKNAVRVLTQSAKEVKRNGMYTDVQFTIKEGARVVHQGNI